MADEDKGEAKPTYFAQMEPDFVKQHGDRLAKHGVKLQNLGEAIIKLEDENAALAKRMERAIIVPGENPTPEELKDFKAKMGLPDNADGYEFDPADLKDVPQAEEAAKALRAALFDAGLTKNQAKKIGALFFGAARAGKNARDAANKEAAEKFEERLEAQFGGDKKKAQAALNLYRAAWVRLSKRDKDMASRVLQAGLFYDPAFAAGIAEAEQYLGDHDFIDGDGGGGKQTKKEQKGRMGNYSPEFQKTHGGGSA